MTNRRSPSCCERNIHWVVLACFAPFASVLAGCSTHSTGSFFDGDGGPASSNADGGVQNAGNPFGGFGGGGGKSDGGAGTGLGGGDAGTGTGTGTGAGTGKGTNACTLKAPVTDKATCNSCAETNCCAQINACMNNNDCMTFDGCVSQCATLDQSEQQACVQECVTDSSSVTMWQTASKCLTDACTTSCK